FLIERGLYNGIMIWADHHKRGISPPPVEWLREHDLSIAFEFHTNDSYSVPCARLEGFGEDRTAYNESWCTRILEYLVALGPGRSAWCLGHENFDSFDLYPLLDEQGSLSFVTPSSPSDGYERYKEWVSTNAHQLHYCRSGRWHSPVLLETQPGYRQGRMTDQTDTLSFLAERNLRMPHGLVLGGVFPQNAHYQFEIFPEQEGFWWECTHSRLPAVPIGISFLRGACAQYNRKSLADVAPYAGYRAKHDDVNMTTSPDMNDWYKRRVSCTSYDEDGKRLSGYSESLFARVWMSLWASGIDSIVQEDSIATHFCMNGKKLELSPLGETHARFADLSLRSARDRGSVIRTAAVVLPFLHGSCPPSVSDTDEWPFRQRPWHGLEPTDGHWAIARFFERAFPDHGRFRHVPYDYDSIPENEAFEHYGRMARMGLDTRAVEEKHVTSTRWGNSLDVLLDNTDSDTLRRYPALVLLGDFENSTPLADLLPGYVEAGGRVLLPRNFPGIVQTGSGYHYRDIPEDPVVIVADGDEKPQVLEQRHGRGAVWIVLEDDFVVRRKDGPPPFADFVEGLLDRFLDDYVPLRIFGPPLEWSVARNGQGLRIYLANHNEYDALPQVYIQSKPCGVRKLDNTFAGEFVANQRLELVELDGQVKFEVAIPAFDFRLVDLPCSVDDPHDRENT
ncbi:MAG: hypothetical protein HQ559_12350, partial [Lentisphaerae bacterium]|nr:hypothetical protein [Lentisphaerota bacterium]